MRGDLGGPEREGSRAGEALGARRDRLMRHEVVVKVGAVVLLHHDHAPHAGQGAGERLFGQRRQHPQARRD